MRRTLSLLAPVAGCLLIAAALLASADEPKPEALTAADILDRVAKVYADCKTYRDTGVVQTVFVKETGNRTVNRPFTTAFVRPNRFRFEYRAKRGEAAGEEYRHIVWRRGQEIQTWWDIQPGVEKPSTIGLALGGANGVSGGSSVNIPSLLLPNEAGAPLTFLSGAKRIADAKLGEMDCFRVEGKRGNGTRTIWIDQKTHLVRQIDERMKFDTFRTEMTTTFDPAIDGEVPDKMLEFDPPNQK